MSGKCFVVVSKVKTWRDSLIYCQLNYFNGTLAEPTTDLDMKATMEFVTSLNFNRNVWIGANDIEVEGRFVWASDNSTMYSTLWDGQQPDNFNNEDCLAMYMYSNNKSLNDYSCSARLNSICQTDPCSSIFPGSVYGYGQCFKYFDQQLTWEQAKSGSSCPYTVRFLVSIYSQVPRVHIQSGSSCPYTVRFLGSIYGQVPGVHIRSGSWSPYKVRFLESIYGQVPGVHIRSGSWGPYTVRFLGSIQGEVPGVHIRSGSWGPYTVRFLGSIYGQVPRVHIRLGSWGPYTVRFLGSIQGEVPGVHIRSGSWGPYKVRFLGSIYGQVPGVHIRSGSWGPYTVRFLGSIQGEETCLSMNSHLAEPETVQMQQLLQFYLSNKTSWLGATNASLGFQFKWIVSNNTVVSNFRLTVNNTAAGSRFILWSTTTTGVVGWVATNGLEPHGFVCQTAAVAPNPRMYVAVFSNLSMDRSNLGKLLVTSSFTKVMYLTIQLNNSTSLQKTKTFLLAKLRWVSVTLSGKVFLNSTDVFDAHVEITASQPVSIVQYITDQSLTMASSTLLYPVAACSLECAAMTSYLLVSTSPFKNDTDFILTITSLSNLTMEVTLVFNGQETGRVISLGSSPISLSNVDTIRTSLDSLYQSLNINMRTKLDGTYLYSTQPVQVLLATSAKTSGQVSFDSSLDELLPLTHISHEYFIFSTTQERKTVVRCQAVYGWTMITWVCHVTLITWVCHVTLITWVMSCDSDYLGMSCDSDYTGNHQDVCVTTLLPSSLWRDEYQFVQVFDNFTATVYIIVDVNMTNDIDASGTNLAWRCQNITGANYAGCLAIIPKNVTYLYLQLTNRQRRFGAYVIGSNQVSTFCHPLGTGDMIYNGSDNIFHHEDYLQYLLSKRRSTECDDELTTYQTEGTTGDTSEINWTTTSDVTLSPQDSTNAHETTTDFSSTASSNASHATNDMTVTSQWADTAPPGDDVTDTSSQSTSRTTPSVKEQSEAIVAYLKVNYQSLSSYRRTLTSAPDPRVSSQTFGCVGVVIVSVVFVLLTLGDVINIVQLVMSIICHRR
ncbi:hypothetical protein Btru_063080 [Bulinus truncatus]|nr:hypothetical protein Btru_063080 [Bulinus truncatus]